MNGAKRFAYRMATVAGVLGSFLLVDALLAGTLPVLLGLLIVPGVVLQTAQFARLSVAPARRRATRANSPSPTPPAPRRRGLRTAAPRPVSARGNSRAA